MICLDTQTLQEIAQYRSNGISWDSIAEELGTKRNTLKSKIIRELGKERWEALAKISPKFNVISDPTKPKKEKKTKPVEEKVKEESKIEEKKPIKFFNTISEEQVVVTIFIGSEKFTKVLDKATDLVSITKAVEEADETKIRNLMSMKSALNSVGISFDQLSFKFNIADVTLEPEAKNLVFKVYNQSVASSSDKPINGLVNIIHRLNHVNKLDKLVQLYNFLVHEDIEILSDGSFICYKYLNKVNGTYVDSYTGTVKQYVRDYIYTQEEKVNNDPNITCSYGLHVCAFDYAYGQKIIAKVLVKPEDVVSVPIDYDGKKLRCKGYTILEILEDCPSVTDFTDTLELSLNPINFIYVNTTQTKEKV